METLQRIWNYQLIPPVPWYYALAGLVLVLVIGLALLWRIVK